MSDTESMVGLSDESLRGVLAAAEAVFPGRVAMITRVVVFGDRRVEVRLRVDTLATPVAGAA